VDELSAAHHEAAHAVVAVSLCLPLRDLGIRIDTVDGGITLTFHRVPGDRNNTLRDIRQREKSILMIKAGYQAVLKLFPGAPAAIAADDREEEVALLDEMYIHLGPDWKQADARLSAEASNLVDKNWDAIRALAKALISKSALPRSAESRRIWPSPYPFEKAVDGQEIALILKSHGLEAIVRSDSEGVYLPPD
jgi:hypothetical protein